MKKLRILLMLWVGLMLAAWIVYPVRAGGPWFVNPTTGNDGNNCLSSGTACKTIAHAEALSSAGDTINLAAGTYRLSTGFSSTAGLIAAKSSQTFTGPSCTPTPGSPCSAIVSGGVQLCVSGLTCSGPDGNGNWSVTGMTQKGSQAQVSACDTGWTGCIYPEELFFDGSPLQHINSATLPTLTTTTWWFDYTNHIIYFHQNPSGHTVETSVLETWFQNNGANSVTIENVTVEEFASQYQQGAGIDPTYGGTASSTTGINWTVQDVYATLNHSAGIRVGFGMLIQNSVINSNGNIAISGGLPAGGTVSGTGIIASGLVVQNNTMSGNNYARFAPGGQGGGFKVGNTAYAVVRNNTITNNFGQGIHFDGNSICPLIDGNTVTGNVDLDASGAQGLGIGIEISNAAAGCVDTVRNNLSRYNGTSATSGPNYQISSITSAGVNAYCNVMEVENNASEQPWTVSSTNRGTNTNQPYLGARVVSTGNYFHHNTVIFDAATGTAGFLQKDTTNQPNFFANNTPPNFNTYHAPSTSTTRFLYDNSNSGSNTSKNFSNYQASTGTPPTGTVQGPDQSGSIDTVNTSGFPTVNISSPADQANVATPFTINATASDSSGISKVEFYIDWNLVSTVTVSPYNYTWPAGTIAQHMLAAMAYSNAGVRACWAVTVNNTSSPQAPTGLQGVVAMKGNVKVF